MTVDSETPIVPKQKTKEIVVYPSENLHGSLIISEYPQLEKIIFLKQ